MPPHGHKRDRCRISTPGTSTRPYPVSTPTWSKEIPCRYSKNSMGESAVANAEFTDSVISVPKGTVIVEGARVHLTKLRRTVLESNPIVSGAVLFDVVGTDWERPQEIVLECKQVKGGSLT